MAPHPEPDPAGRSPVGHHHRVPSLLSPQPILPIELVALDIDGTLIGDDLVIGPDTRAAVRAALARGVLVSIVTGRMVSSAMRFARELRLTAPVVGYQGALIRSMPEPGSTRLGRLLHHRPIRAGAARAIVEWTREQGLDPHINHLERFILRADDPNADDYSAFMGARAELVADLPGSILHPVTKVLAVGKPPLPTSLAPLARTRFEGLADVTISHPKFLEFVAPGVSKGQAVRWLARRLGVRLGATLAIGDQWNDLEMLAEVGHGVAMPSAPSAVQAVARYIAPPLAEEGVARMIEALVLARPEAAWAASRRMAEAAAAARAGLESRAEAAEAIDAVAIASERAREASAAPGATRATTRGRRATA
jgi:Cof subfamily protein (haloacid dehalogenase superfamily)